MKENDHETLLQRCGRLLIENKLTVAFAESATAGRISAEFALIPNAGKFLKGGIVCYDAEVKTSLLRVPEEQLKTFTPESDIVTCLITSGLQKLISADIHIGCTGLTAPGGSETSEKPVGTMFLYGIRNNELIFSDRSQHPGDPEEIILSTIYRTAQLMIDHLKR